MTCMILRLRRFAATALAAGFLMMVFPPAATVAANDTTTQLKFEGGHFAPASFNVTAGAPVKLTVLNNSDSAIEFESFELNRERVVQPGASITVLLPKLDPGNYHFIDDFHHDVPQGTITAN